MQQTFRKRPLWVDEEHLIQSLLIRFLDKCERNVKLQLRLNEKTTPELYDFDHEDTEYLWGLITALDNEYHILTIKRQRSTAGQEIYHNAQLIFNPDQEALVRHWLNRPVLDPYTLIWKSSIEKNADKFEGDISALVTPIIYHDDYTAEQVIDGFVKLSSEIKHRETLRSLSARCFWGESKFLDKREELVKALFPIQSKHIIPRPILTSVYIPADFKEVVFVENQDTFLMMANFARSQKNGYPTALVYSGGFRGSASRSRKLGHAVFSHLSRVDHSHINRFERWWFALDDRDIPSYFWGDLDFSAMAILSALKKIFHSIQAWEPGYEAMLEYVQTGIFHPVSSGHKHLQKDPEATHCIYADNVLLPLIRRKQCFLDQEVVVIEQIYKGCEH